MKFNEVTAKTVAEIARTAKLLQFMLDEPSNHETQSETEAESALADSVLAEIETMCVAIRETAPAKNNQLADLAISALMDKAKVLSLWASQWETAGIPEDGFKQIGDLSESIAVAVVVLSRAIQEG